MQGQGEAGIIEQYAMLTISAEELSPTSSPKLSPTSSPGARWPTPFRGPPSTRDPQVELAYAPPPERVQWCPFNGDVLMVS